MLLHLTMNSGDLTTTTAADVDLATVMPVLEPLISSGKGSVPGTELTVTITLVDGSAAFTFWGGARHPQNSTQKPTPIATCLLAWKSEAEQAAWSEVEKLYFVVSEAGGGVMLKAGSAMPSRPGKLPWLSVVVMPGMVFMSRDTVGMIGDLERCMAAAILAKHGLWPGRQRN
ncbi:MAG: hypothetical protein IT581_20160 [Verrucomicrobiales bacterium]|nr:hypothetical protein [Verrucomicrobiales bacterium]